MHLRASLGWRRQLLVSGRRAASTSATARQIASPTSVPPYTRTVNHRPAALACNMLKKVFVGT